MRNNMILAAALLVASPALAQTPAAHPAGHNAAAVDGTPVTGSMTATDLGVQPMTGVSAVAYAEYASDSNRYEIESSKIAIGKSNRSDVKAFARMVIADHETAQGGLKKALKNPARKVAKPNDGLSRDNSAQIDALKSASREQFDTLYISQQMAAHKKSWALHRGYADTGEDTTFKQLAATQVPVIERHIAQLRTMDTSQVASR